MVTIRPAAPSDAAELAKLLNAIIVRGGTTAFETAFTPGGLSEAYLTGPAAHCCFVAQADGRIAGFQTLGTQLFLPAYIGDIATFARLGSTQGGVGTALFAATTAHARELGLTAINATIRADNTGGLTFYTRMGFTDYEIVRGVPLKNGTPVDRIRKRFVL
ncbi:N-acetyltransferase family protein [Sandarakinorhabdus sp.]|uniref:GNAT family N-acetyltransferase n=1 Tax=Sandarakinorhabdus sp. TaxID=1916663 RepID=UPI003562DA3E